MFYTFHFVEAIEKKINKLKKNSLTDISQVIHADITCLATVSCILYDRIDTL